MMKTGPRKIKQGSEILKGRVKQEWEWWYGCQDWWIGWKEALPSRSETFTEHKEQRRKYANYVFS